MKNTRSKCYTYFRIAGDFDPDTVSELLGIRAERAHRLGDMQKNGTIYDHALWTCGYCHDETLIISEQMICTIEPLLPKVSRLREIKERFDVSFYLEVVPTLSCKDEVVPCLAPSLDVMRFCCDTGTELHIDLYIVGEE